MTDNKKNYNEADIVDIDLSATRKKVFRVNGDNERMLELNISDFGFLTRLEEGYAKLNAIVDGLQDMRAIDLDEEDGLSKLAETFAKKDKEMRDTVDFIFDADVSKVCAPDGSMYDLFNGILRFEYIIEILVKLYEDNIQKEFKKMQKRVANKTSKYTGKK